MSLQKLHYENISGTLVQREGLLSWRCPLCKAEGQSLEVMRTCPECGSKEATLPGAQLAMSVPREAIEKMLTQLMDIAVSNGANSVSMPDEYVEVAAWLCGIPAQPAPIVPECPYPCGWRNLLKHAIEDGAYLARSINEDEPVTENARAVTMRMVMRLRDVLMAVNNAAPEVKP